MGESEEEYSSGAGEHRSFVSRRRGFSWRPRTVAVAVVLVLLVAGGVWYWIGSRDQGRAPITAAPGGDTAAAPAAAGDTAADLPELGASDALVRDLVAGLSSHPRLAEWLVTENLVRRFVGAVVSVAAGTSPRTELEFLGPEGEFRVRHTGTADSAVVVDSASYRRYDPVAETFVSLDTPGTARLYRRLRPLFGEAYRELGFREGSFDGVLARAVENLLAVPVPDGPVEVVPAAEGTDWEYRDPRLERLSPAQKHLLRMGPQNIRRVQAKLRELARALDLPMLTGSAESAGPSG